MIQREDVSKEEWDKYRSGEERAKLAAGHLAALQEIVAGGLKRLAYIPAVELAAKGHSDEVMEELVGLGLAVCFPFDCVDQFTLTEYGTWLMQVQILERVSLRGDGIEEDPYWAEIGKEPSPIHIPAERRKIRCPWAEQGADPKAKRPDEVMRDEDGDVVKVLGMEVPVDPRLKGKGKGGAKQARRRAG